MATIMQAGVKIHRPDLSGKPKLIAICVWDKTKLLKSKSSKSEGKGLIFKSTATGLMNKGPQIPACLQVVDFHSSLTFLGGIQKMALLGSPCSSQVKGIISRVRLFTKKTLHSLKKQQVFDRSITEK